MHVSYPECILVHANDAIKGLIGSTLLVVGFLQIGMFILECHCDISLGGYRVLFNWLITRLLVYRLNLSSQLLTQEAK